MKNLRCSCSHAMVVWQTILKPSQWLISVSDATLVIALLHNYLFYSVICLLNQNIKIFVWTCVDLAYTRINCFVIVLCWNRFPLSKSFVTESEVVDKHVWVQRYMPLVSPSQMVIFSSYLDFSCVYMIYEVWQSAGENIYCICIITPGSHILCV